MTAQTPGGRRPFLYRGCFRSPRGGGFSKKNSGPAPEGLSIQAGTGVGHPPLWCPTMALKIKIPEGSRGALPWRLFARPYSISLGQMRKYLRGPGQATYDFDGVRPGLLVDKKGGGPQARLLLRYVRA